MRPGRAAGGLLPPLVLVGCWQAAVSSGVVDLQFLPSPSAIGRSFVAELRSGTLLADVGHTLGVALAATALAAVIGGVLGTVLGLVSVLRMNVLASIDFMRTVPAIALMPVALLILGPRTVTELVLATYAATWPIVLATTAGVANVPARLRDVARVLHLSPATLVRTVVVPAAVPGWLSGARTSAIIALHVTLIAEMVVAPSALGGGLVSSLQGLNPARMWAYAVTCGLVGSLLHAVLRRAVRIALPGSPANRPVGAP